MQINGQFSKRTQARSRVAKVKSPLMRVKVAKVKAAPMRGLVAKVKAPAQGGGRLAKVK